MIEHKYAECASQILTALVEDGAKGIRSHLWTIVTHERNLARTEGREALQGSAWEIAEPLIHALQDGASYRNEEVADLCRKLKRVLTA